MRAGQAPNAKPDDKKAFDEGFARLLKELKANTAGEGSKQIKADGLPTNTAAGALATTAKEPVPSCCATTR